MTTEKSASAWYLYMIENKYNHLYTGISTDWQRRFQEHSSDGKKTAKALKGKGPLQLLFCAQLEDHHFALQAEIWVKKQTRKTKLLLIAKQVEMPFKHTAIHSTKLKELTQGLL
ncbi:GIY-YIG nuclease family protein [Glaciecola petra]|uniref:GIY-YIG nuclease family protein n=1 Tax=Glaciecola petra TaxID=3075602 RepID=A0ABU2ZLT9_9ALTE|nr:GIY-YIG nuclease family protein [Aestuariibacter sp. P117]MDT0593590.1 GIY-YIG nuclease family protein [Aestuariibacter sp. P117]